MTTSTPLPEQGRFNEKLTEILSNFWHYQNDHGKDRGITFDEAKAAIRTLVLEEIIGEDASQVGSIPVSGAQARMNRFKAEQRKKLGGSDGTK